MLCVLSEYILAYISCASVLFLHDIYCYVIQEIQIVNVIKQLNIIFVNKCNSLHK